MGAISKLAIIAFATGGLHKVLSPMTFSMRLKFLSFVQSFQLLSVNQLCLLSLPQLLNVGLVLDLLEQTEFSRQDGRLPAPARSSHRTTVVFGFQDAHWSALGGQSLVPGLSPLALIGCGVAAVRTGVDARIHRHAGMLDEKVLQR